MNAGGAAGWLNAFDAACVARTGKQCAFDFPCTHAYFFPEPCDGLPSWACARSMMAMIQGLSRRYGGKPVWITEWACPKWIAHVFTDNGHPAQYCDEARQLALVAQMLPQLDAADYVFRYSWDLNRWTGYAWSDGPGSDVVLASNNSLLSPRDYPGYPSTLTALGQAYGSYSIACADALRDSCGGSPSHDVCMVCAGRAQRALRSAGCTEPGILAFCAVPP